MPIKSTSERYGSVAITLHWLSALGIVVLLASGFALASADPPGDPIAILRVHGSVGFALGLVTLLRIAWWLAIDRRPSPPQAAAWQNAAARVVHVLFYIVIVGMVASGIGMMALSGAGEILSVGEGTLPDFWDYLPRRPHYAGARAMVALIAVHTAAALYHHYGMKDGLIRRMWYGRTQQH